MTPERAVSRKSFVPGLVALIVVVLAIGVTWDHRPVREIGSRSPDTASLDDPIQTFSVASVPSDVLQYLQGVTPHVLPINAPFADTSESALSLQDKKLKYATLIAMGVDEEYFGEYSLRVVGKRYVVMQNFPPAGKFGSDVLVDFQEGTVLGLAGGYSFDTKHAVVYIDDTSIKYYKPDAPSVVELPGSQLSGSESYIVNDGMMPSPEETHTDTSVTLDVVDSSRIAADGVNYVQVRTVTFSLP